MVAIVAAIAALSVFGQWRAPTVWEPDGLFYEAQKREVMGQSPAAARQAVFTGPLAEMVGEEDDLAPALRRVGNPEWVEYSSRFYRRRWTVPAVAAGIDGVAGDEAIKRVALLGYVAAIVMLYLLLRRRFAVGLSATVALGCVLLPPLRYVAADPGTDSWGVALLAAGLACGSLALDRGRRWLLPWVAIVLLLSFTRDLTAVLVVAAAWVALRSRTRQAAWLAGSALLASIPAPLIAGVSVRENLAYVIDDFRIPADSSWAHVAEHYPGSLLDLIGANLSYPLEHSFPPLMFLFLLLALVGALALIFAPLARGDAFYSLMRGALIGGALTLFLSINATGWRLELALLPSLAVGVAIAATAAWRLVRSRTRPQADGAPSTTRPQAA